MRKLLPILLLPFLLSGFRAFPSLAEQDPHVVFNQFQDALDHATTLDDVLKFMSKRLRREYEHKAELATTPVAADELLQGLRKNFFLIAPAIATEEIQATSAILVYKGAVDLDGLDVVAVTNGVVLVKEDGAWKVDRDKIAFTITTTKDGETHEEAGRKAM